MTALASVEGLEVFYGASQALFGVDLSVEPGQAVALMGRNGMGKTTTIRTLCRMQAPYKGKVWFDGQDITRLPSYKAARLGIGLVPEGRRCFATLTVTENLIAAARPGPWTLQAVHDFFPRLGERADQQAATLSGGEQQMLAIGRALMTNPRLLVLDEATEGLAPVIRKEIWAAISRLKGQGQAILIVDKTLSELKPIADACVILERGRSVWRGTPAEITPEIETQYLGL
jgi:branched-chain amino acid transport system ATP-binding protein